MLLLQVLLRRKIQGKASFGSIQDSKGKIQVYFNRDVICPSEDKSMYNDFKKWLDLGDILGIEGKVFKTMVGEISINVDKFHLLSKSLKPLPPKPTTKELFMMDLMIQNLDIEEGMLT